MKLTTVRLPQPLAKRVGEYIVDSDFLSVSDFVRYAIRVQLDNNCGKANKTTAQKVGEDVEGGT